MNPARPKTTTSTNVYMADDATPEVHIFRDDHDPSVIDFVTVKSNLSHQGSDVTLFFADLEQANRWVTDLVVALDREVTRFYTRTQEVHHEGS